MVIALGDRAGQTIRLDLGAAHGLRLTGPGGRRAERALLQRLVTGCVDGSYTLLTVAKDVHRLSDQERPGSAGPGTLTGVRVEPTLTAALDHLAAELVQRIQTEETDSARSHGGAADIERAGKAVPSLILVLDPADGGARLQAELRVAARCGVGAIMLGDWPYGTTLVVDDTGKIVEATGPAAGDLVGTLMPLSEETDAHQGVGVLDGGDRSTAARVGKPATDDSASGRDPVVCMQTPPVLIRLLGRCIVEGPAERSNGAPDRDVWGLFGLLAEHRGSPLPRHVVYQKLWPDTEVNPDLFWARMKEARGRLCAALGQPPSYGKNMLRTIAGEGYQINSDLCTFDIWGLRDALAQAGTATGGVGVEALTRAVDLYTGPYLPKSPHGWAQIASRRVDRQVVRALTQLAKLEPDPERAVSHLEKATEIDTSDEHLYRWRMKIYAVLGRLEAVRHCYEELTSHLPEGKLEPLTTDLYEKLRRQP